MYFQNIQILYSLYWVICAWFGAYIAKSFVILIVIFLLLLVVFWLQKYQVFITLIFGLLCFCIVSTSAYRSVSGLTPPMRSAWTGWVTLMNDPIVQEYLVTAHVKLNGKRYVLTDYSYSQHHWQDKNIGDSCYLTGIIRSFSVKTSKNWLYSNHLVGRIDVIKVQVWSISQGLSTFSEKYRGLIKKAAKSLPESQQGLFLGFVLGDNSTQQPFVTELFSDAGLQHLLVVSGQNVAFLLLLLKPFIYRLRFYLRFIAQGLVLFAFLYLTRFEPSVMRAATMVLVASWNVVIGKPKKNVYYLFVAILCLLFIDPMLIYSVGFHLSLAATFGIIVFAKLFYRYSCGPKIVREIISVTLAAQIGVAPLLFHYFGKIPYAFLMANTLAVPFAGFVMMWGMSVGAFAGFFSSEIANVLLAPVGVVLYWILRSAIRSNEVFNGTFTPLTFSIFILGIVGSFTIYWKIKKGVV